MRSRIVFVLVFVLLLFGGAASALGHSGGVSPQIVHGTSVPDGKYPFMGALSYGNSPFAGQYCGAFLIAPQYALTAAHCSAEVAKDPSGWNVVFACSDLNSSGCLQIGVDRVTVYPHYKQHRAYDVAVLHLATPAPFRPLVLAGPGDDNYRKPGSMVIEMGWGSVTQHLKKNRKDNGNDDYPAILQEVSVPIVSRHACAKDFNGHNFRYGLKICAGKTGSGSCFGDSGGPLVARGPDGSLVGIGIDSGGVGCADPKYPEIYTRIAAKKIYQFIQRTIVA